MRAIQNLGLTVLLTGLTSSLLAGESSAEMHLDDNAPTVLYTIDDESLAAEEQRAPPPPTLADETKQRLFCWRTDDLHRAGQPLETRCLTIPSRTSRYGGYLVGGGVPVLGEGPYPCEGTWGWDYRGFVPKLIALHWSHGRKQGGLGAYKMDGPRLK